ncbi:O-mannosyltransferase [Paraphysoderma sedebokerense]|nr:O-mannosyltransferase [Paraphysoderma sedebokerense]
MGKEEEKSTSSVSESTVESNPQSLSNSQKKKKKKSPLNPSTGTSSATPDIDDSNVRKRKQETETETDTTPLLDSEDTKKSKRPLHLAPSKGNERTWSWKILTYVITSLSFATRFYALHFPPQVVFDEVHFGKFASYYIRRTYYFDVHPPLGRLLFALVGILIGYDGHYNFANIGEDYVKNKVPYVQLRAWPALCGALVAPLGMEILRELGFSHWAVALAGLLIVFDNALIAQSRLILLDSMLMLFMTFTLYCYVKFSKQRKRPFSRLWWKWLVLTGTSLGLVMGVKMVGLFTVASVGVGVLVELWYLLHPSRTTMRQFIRHFSARVLCLILLPFALYLSYFYIHFAVLIKTGPGDAFMSPAFQATLIGNKMSEDSKAIFYGSNITIKHYDTAGYLHSHKDKYPLRYEDGRISSQGQQVTAYPHKDLNNLWRIFPRNATAEEQLAILSSDSPYVPVKNEDEVVLQHITTNTFLLTHDVASPLMPTNQEFTTVAPGVRVNETWFRIEFDRGAKGDEFKTLGVNFRLVHVLTGVAAYTHKDPLPDWGFGQQEVNGNKKKKEKSNMWIVEECTNVNRTALLPKSPSTRSTLARPSFLAKFVELQSLMFSHNAGLTKPHPYQSPPKSWPFVIRGISFWQDSKDKQIYLLGNPVGWWMALVALGVYAVGWVFEVILRRRESGVLDEATCRHLHYSAGFLFISYCLHYLPFFLMGRSLFLHHYLPAAILSFLVFGSVYDFILKTLFPSLSSPPPNSQMPASPTSKDKLGATILTAVLIGAVIASFFVFEPMTYGVNGLTKEEVKNRKWIDTWDFQYGG